MDGEVWQMKIYIEKQNLWYPWQREMRDCRVLRVGRFCFAIAQTASLPWWHLFRWVFVGTKKHSVTIRVLWFYFGWKR